MENIFYCWVNKTFTLSLTLHISNPFHLTPILFSDTQHYMGNTVCVVVLLDKSVDLLIYVFCFIRIRKPQLHLHICWVEVLCFAVRFAMKSAKAVSYGLTCHSWRKFVTMWESWGQNLPLNRRRDSSVRSSCAHILHSAYSPSVIH